MRVGGVAQKDAWSRGPRFPLPVRHDSFFACELVSRCEVGLPRWLAVEVATAASPGGLAGQLVVSPADPALHAGAEISLADLRQLPRVSLHEMHCLGQQISGFCSQRRVGPNVVCHTTQLSTLLEFVRLGLGVSIVPEMAAR